MRWALRWLLVLISFSLLGSGSAFAVVPGFIAAFSPNTIGPGSTSQLTFTIDNSNPASLTQLAFSNTFPANVTIADAPDATTTCSGASISAPAGGSTLTFGGDGNPNGASVTASSSCTISVRVMASLAGSYINTSSTLASSEGTTPAASDTLDVIASRPGFTKAFSASTTSFGSTVALTFTVDNTANASPAFRLSFSDILPAGLTVASPNGAVATCAVGTVTAAPGSSSISYSTPVSATESVAAGDSCTVSVNVVAGAAGSFENVSQELLSSSTAGGALESSGTATASLTVTPVSSTGVALTEQFLSSSAAPGSSIDVRFTLLNSDSSFTATDITFTDDLDAALSGLIATGLPLNNVCGSGSQISGSSLLTLSGGSLAARASCSFTVSLTVPSSAPDGTVTNVTSAPSATINGSTVVSTAASAEFDVDTTIPVLTKSFTNDPVAIGDTVTLEYTISNAAGAATISDLAFSDPIDSILPMVAAGDVTLPAGGFCGGASMFFSLGDIFVLGGELAAGTSCTFDVDIVIPDGTTAGSLVSTSEVITGTVGAASVSGPGATDTLVVTAPSLSMNLSKSFTDDPVVPGGTATLEFTLVNNTEGVTVTDIGFTDDLNFMLAGTVASNLPADGFCGPGSQLTGTSLLTMTGGVLAEGGSCELSVSVLVPSGATAATYTNTTSDVSGDPGGGVVTDTGSAASDDLTVSTVLAVTGAMSFTDDPTSPGGMVTLEYTLTNPNASDGASAVSFSHSLGSTVSGLTSISGTLNNVCDVGSQITGTTTLVFTGGTIAAASSCNFSVTLQVPAGATPADYGSVTGAISSTVAAAGQVSPGAADTLTVRSPFEGLVVTKSFVADPVLPGDTVVLQFTMDNAAGTDDLDAISFTDDLDAMLTGAVATVLEPGPFCGGATMTGTSELSINGASLAAGAACTFQATVLVPGGASPGLHTNTTSVISVTSGSVSGTLPAVTDQLSITPSNVTMLKSFTDDPVLPGGTVTLEFSIFNPAAGGALSDIRFSDDLEATLSGLVATGLPVNDVCGTGSTLSGTSAISLSGGGLAAGADCTFSVTLQVPVGAPPGTYGNITSDVTEGVAVIAGPASDTMDVGSPVANMLFTKSFTNDPVFPGGNATIQFTITNPDTVSSVSAVGFVDDLDAMLSGATGTALPAPGFCGGATITGSSTLTMSGGALAPGGGCSFTIGVQVPTGATSGNYTNTTGALAGTVNGVAGTANSASDALEVASTSNITFTKSFSDDPVLSGATVTLDFTVTNPAPSAALTNINFTDDLNAALSGLVATGLPQASVCGSGSSLSGTSSIVLTGGALAAGESCSFSVTLQVPTSAPPGTYTNTTSILTEGTIQIAAAASDDLVINSPVPNLQFTKSFTDDPIAPGTAATLEFTITNNDTTLSVTAIGFTDDLDAMLSGATGVSLPATGFCGGSAQIAGSSLLTMTGGSLGPSSNCSFSVSVQIPPDAVPTTYTNTTSALSGNVNGVPSIAGTATDTLSVGAAPTLTVTPATDFEASGPQNGPFGPASQVYTLRNNGTFDLSYTAAGDQAFFNVTPASGTIPAGGTTPVTAALDAAVTAGLPAGDHSGAVTFTNLSNASATKTRTVSLTVEALGSVTIVQKSTAGDGTFTFSSPTEPSLSFSLTTVEGEATSSVIDLAAGVYETTQTPPDDGYALVAASCNDADSAVDLDSRTATIAVSAGEAVICTFESVNARGRTVEVINRFLHRRTDLILSSEPDGGRRIDRLRNSNGGASGSGAPFEFGLTSPGSVSATFETSVSQIRAAYAAQDAQKEGLLATYGAFSGGGGLNDEPPAKWDFWLSGQITQFEDDTGGGDGDGLFGIVYAGADYRVSSELLIGVLLQIDYLDQQWDDLQASASGTGWMAGPYATVKITENLFFDARAAWGLSSNDVSPFNTYTDTFETERWLVRAGLIGDWRWGDWIFRPSANVAYMTEDQAGYVDTLNVTIPGQQVSLGQFDFGPSISYRYKTAEGLLLEPSATLTGIWNFSQDTGGVTTTTNSAAIDFRARAEIGLRARVQSGMSVEAFGSYDGIGVEDYQALSGRAVLSVPF